MMTITNSQTQVCFDAWMKCENLLTDLAMFRTAISNKIKKVIDECALICMGTFHALKSGSSHINRFAVLCVGICEECAELCEELNDDDFRTCAVVCRKCSQTMTDIAFTNLQ
jgi:hypothetical protein